MTAVKAATRQFGYPVRLNPKLEAIMGRRSGTAPPENETSSREPRDAFDRGLEPHYAELLVAARREVRHGLATGAFEPDDPTPEQLLDMALQRAWRGRQSWPEGVGVKAWALATLFRTAEILGARKAARARKQTELLPEEVAANPLYQDDDEEFWQSYELEYPRDTVVFSGDVDWNREDPTDHDDELGVLPPLERHVLLMHEVHGVALDEVARALGISPSEAQDLLASARRRTTAAGTATR